MGYFLALESSGRRGSTAVVDEKGTLISEFFQENNARHAKGLFSGVDTCVCAVPGGRNGLSGIIVDIGPGSFTGLRVGVMSAKILAWSLHIPVCGVYSLDALAWRYRNDFSSVAVCTSARKDEVYLACYVRLKNTMTRIEPIRAFSPGDALRILSQMPSGTLALGSGLTQMPHSSQDLPGLSFLSALEEHDVPAASSVAFLGARHFVDNLKGGNPFTLQPFYTRQEGVSMPVLGEPLEGI